MKRNNFVSRSLSFLLCLVMILGFIPGGIFQAPEVQAAEPELEPIVIDFEGLAQELKDKEWWTGEYLGNRTAKAEITDAQKAQYSALLDYLAENKNWTINENQSKFNQPSYWNKRMIIDAADEYPWATCLYTGYMNVPNTIGQDGFQMDLNVTAEQAGTYRLDLEAFREGVSTTAVVPDMVAGSGRIKVQVNGQTALGDTLTTGDDVMDTFEGEVVELREGVNTIVIRCTGDMWGNNQAARRNLYVNKLTFVPADATEPEPPVNPDGPGTPDEPAEGGDLRIDFNEMAREIKDQSWWKGLHIGTRYTTETVTDAQKEQYAALIDYLSENKNWTFNETASKFNQPSYWAKRLTIDTADKYDWATCLYSTYMNVPAQDSFQIDLTVTKEQAGRYQFNLDAFMENIMSIQYPSDMYAGSGQIKIEVNGDVALEDTLTTGDNKVGTFKGNVVRLKEGVNTIVVHSTGDISGGSQGARRNLYVNAMYFTKPGASDPNKPVAPEIGIDLDVLALELAEQDWWKNLDLGTKIAGAGQTDAQIAQYDALLNYLSKTRNWTINESKTNIKETVYYTKLLRFDAADEYDWATCLYTGYINVPAQDSIQFDMTVSKEQAGEYQLNLKAFMEGLTSSNTPDDMYSGAGYVKIDVNGQTALASTSLAGDNKVDTIRGEVVSLKEGVNTITVHCSGDYFGANESGRRCLYLSSISFEEPVIVHETKGDIEIDFKAFGKEVGQQDWWQGLDFGSNAVKVMTDEQTAQYDAMLEYLSKNKYWTINEDGTGFKKPTRGYGKWLILNTGDDYDWGAALYSIYVGSPEGNALQLDVTVSAEDAGTYWMSLDAFLDDLKSIQSPPGMYPGAGYVTVDVNGETVIAHRQLTGGNVVATIPGGYVELKEGINTIRIHNSADFWNSGNAARRTIYLNKVRFDKVETVEGPIESLRMDFKSFAKKVSTRDWWEGFGYVTDDVKYFGCEKANDVHGSRGTSYGLMQNFMQEDDFWSIDEDLSKFGTNDALKRIYLDNSDSPAGLRFYPNYFAGQNADNPAYSQLVFSVRLPKGAEGWYEMDLEALHETAEGNIGTLLLGGGYGDIYVNGELVCEDYDFGSRTKETYTKVDTLGKVWLNDGNNTVTIDMTADNNGSVNQARRAISLCAIEFRGVDAVAGKDTMAVYTKEAVSLRMPKTAEVPVYAFRNGWEQIDLSDAEITVMAEDELVKAEVLPVAEGEPACIRFEGIEAGQTTVTVTVKVDDVEATVEIDVTVKDPAVLKEFSFGVKHIENQVARFTTQDLDLNMIGIDGEAILPEDAQITYKISDEEVVEVVEEDYTIRTLKNGPVTITATATVGGVTKTDSVDLTVADTGVNTLGNNGDFENGVGVKNWIVYGPDSGMFNFTEAVDDGTGNTAMRITINPNVSCRDGFSSTEVITRNGHFAELQPGHMYEISVKTKNSGLKKPDEAKYDFQYVLQFYDYSTNGRGDAGILCEVMEQMAIPVHDREDWETIRFYVQAPITWDGPIYVMPRIVIRAKSENEYDLTGFEGTIWYDDISIHEVGFERVELELRDPMTSTTTPTTLYIKPVTTTGNYVEIDEEFVPKFVTAYSTNEDVVQLTSSPVRTAMPNNQDYLPGATVKLVGLNAQAELVANVTLGGFTKEGRLDLSQTAMPNVLRDITYTIGGEQAALLKFGAKAEGDVNARTTQLDPLNEAYVRENGSVYFASSDTSVVKVDQTTGDVTAVGEGTAVVTAYALMNGITAKSAVTVTVSDDTDLVSLTLDAAAKYVPTGTFLQLTPGGSKASGGKADLSNVTLSYSVDEAAAAAGIATVSEKGMVYGLKPGNVTVTASISVMGKTVSTTIDLEVVDAQQLPQNDLMIDFTFGSMSDVQNLTLEKDGVAINRDKSYARGAELKIPMSYGFANNIPAGESMALDFVLRRSGWYAVEITGALYNNGNFSDIFVDDAYIGTIDFHNGKNGAPYSAMCKGNTIWLDAGVHTVVLTAKTAGVQYLGRVILRATTDPKPIKIETTLGKTELLVGEKTGVQVSAVDANGRTFNLKAVDQVPDYTNYYILSTANTGVATVSDTTVTGAGNGTTNVMLLGQINGEAVESSASVSVAKGTVANVTLTAEQTTLKPGAEPFPVTVSAYRANGTAVTTGYTVKLQSADPSIATITQEGVVTLTGKLGSVLLTAIVDDNGRQIEAQLWITVTEGKTAPTVYTYEERAIAQENVQKYDWAWSMKEKAVTYADFIVENLDIFYNMLIRESLPRSSVTAFKTDPAIKLCHYCGTDLQAIYSHYPWIVDPINNPWKITCPICMRDFPSNDFEAYYKSGLDEQGYFKASRADKSLLVNELYPEMGEGWGVDDGFGYHTGKYTATGVEEVHTYIALYVFNLFYDFSDMQDNDIGSALNALREAYLYTGDEKYGSAGAILTDRLADIYPEYDGSQYSSYYTFGDGGNYQGKIVGNIWEASSVGLYLTRAVDAFWPAMDNPDVIEYLRGKAVLKGISPDEITPEYLRKNSEDNILREVADACITYKNAGNFGMTQACMATAAVALDTMPETEEWLDWAMRYGEVTTVNGKYHVTGGNALYNIIDLLDRNGFGNECSVLYNSLWLNYLADFADALDGYTGVEGVDMWKNAKFVDMYRSYTRTIIGDRTIALGEGGSVQGASKWYSKDRMLTAFVKTGDPILAQGVYFANGNSAEGLHADIFTKDPMNVGNEILAVIREHGELDLSISEMLTGNGVAIHREAPSKFLGKNVNADQFSAAWMYFGHTDHSHAQLDALNIDIDAYGLSLSSQMGYPLSVSTSSAERMQWIRNTVSHNTVVVDDRGQSTMKYGGFPLHFDDAGKVKVMDAEAPAAYTQTDIYRRTLVDVVAPNGKMYTVDFFRILGGSEHVYSFHAATRLEPELEGLDMTEQAMGTYAGADVPFGAYYYQNSTDPSYNQSGGYSWLDGVSRDDAPEAVFSMDFPIEDFHHVMDNFNGVHLKVTMLSEEPVNEVALANGHPSQNGTNPEYLKYMLVRRSGNTGLDSLFTTVIEPYQYESQVASSELVDVKLVSGNELVTDRAAAIKVTLTDGRVDYIVYASNPECLYEVDGKFSFRGFIGVCSYYGKTMVYAYGNEATQVGEMVEDARPVLTGTVTSFTEGLSLDGYKLTIKLDQNADVSDFDGRYIYVDNDGERNAAYRIHSATVNGNTAVLDLAHQTLVRSFVDGNNMDLGYSHNIAVGQTFRIPLSASADITGYLNSVDDMVVRSGYKVTATAGVINSDVTYKAVGLVSGMKFNAADATLTWTPAKAQAGRYPITVQAVNADGNVVGEVDYVIYAVAYTGSAYDASICTHGKAVIYEVDGTIETICPACGTITKKAVDDQITKFDVVGSNMTLGNELKLNIMVNASDVADGTYTARISHNGQITEEVFRKYNSSYSYVPYSVCAKQMSDMITVEIFNEDGNAVSNVYEISIRNYAMNLLTNPAMGDKIKTLLVDMLNYGTQAQTYFKYNTADLANSKLSEAQKALATKAVACTNAQVKGDNFYGTNVSLEDRILLNLFFRNVTEGFTAKISYTDYTGKEVAADVRMQPYSGSIYKVVVDQIVLADAFSPVTVTVYDADGAVFSTAVDSVESYVARTGNSAINEAIMKFAYAARAYLG